jgi:LmbE family N-acetylglucosaminyl deacetylase
VHPSELQRLLAGRPVRLLGVWAHPDDEAYLSAGLMGRVVRSGGRVACLTATRGERGVDPDDPRAPATIERLREAELRASLAAVGAHSLRFLGHTDGACERIPLDQGITGVRRAIEATRPDVIVTFGPDGITGHPDHLAVHRWVTGAWQRTGQGQLLYATMSETFLARYRGLHESIGLFGQHRPVGTADARIDLTVALDDRELDQKRRALAAHCSQTTALAAAVGESTYRSWWSVETFRRADQPARSSAASRHRAASSG